MKKSCIKFVVIAILGLIGISIFSIDTNTKQLTELVLENIEALAQSEGPNENVICFGSGDIDCYGYKVEDMYSGYNLKP